ncbi:hypothetical protein KR054_012288 [Drosophila jambulina]|nr:hypothetical protein KR054_012288 [Drosophila jambulina]
MQTIETTNTITSTTFTVRKMTGRRISKLSTILLLCAALLLTKSCGIVALSGDGSGSSGQDLAQAEPWSDTTTTLQPGEEGSGSGWESTTTELANEETTEAAENPTTLAPEETTQPEEETTKAENNNENETSTSADQEGSGTTPADQESSSSGSGNGETTTPADQESSSSGSGDGETTTDAPQSSASTSAPEQSSPSAAPEDTTTLEPENSSSSSSSSVAPDTTIAPTPPTFKCETAGLFPHISGDCQRYHNCLFNPLLHQLQDVELTCPNWTVFSASLKRCVRDVAECPDDTFQCPGVGRFAGHDDTYYYSCVASLQGGFHKFVVRCSSGQRFEATIGGCWRYDWTQIVPGQEATEVSDLAAIKRELKQYKAEEKLRLKAQKQQEKLARKQQKLEEKAAKKAAKEQAKQQAKADKDKAKGGESIESAESAE